MDNLNNAMKPVKEAMEPYKIHEGEFERGVPKTHDKYGKLILVLYREFVYIRIVVKRMYTNSRKCSVRSLKSLEVRLYYSLLVLLRFQAQIILVS